MCLKISLIFNLVFVMCQRNVFADEEACAQSEIFMDKTLLIKEFFKRNRTYLITVPRGFGKTTNMDMFRRFCEIQVDEDGTEIPRNKTKYYKVFSDIYLKNNTSSVLDVYKDQMFFNQFFARYPVIHMDFTSLSCSSWIEFKESLVKIISELFNYHKYLLSSDTVSDKDKISFRNYQFNTICKELEPAKLAHSLSYLASLMCKFFNQKVILLIDETDSVLHASIMGKCSGTDKIINFINNFISSILNSNYVMEAVLNSSSRLVEVLIKGVKNIDNFLFYEKHPFNKYYGFSEEEVIELAEIFNLKNNMSTIRDWYNGYIIKKNIRMYNFESISNVFLKKDVGIHCLKGNNPERFENLFLKKNVRKKVKILINDGILEVEPVKDVSVKDVLRLMDIFGESVSTKISPKYESLIFDYMLNLGYFTRVYYYDSCSKFRIKVPNIEAKSELLDLYYSMPHFKNKLNLTDEEIFTLNETSLDTRISKY